MITGSMSIECSKCGHVRVTTLDAIRSGQWLREPCPVCGRSRNDELQPVPRSVAKKARKKES